MISGQICTLWKERRSDGNGWRVDTGIYLDEMSCLIRKGYRVVIPVTGGSMFPFLAGGRDAVALKKPVDRELKKGAIVLYQRTSGQYVLHRIHAVRSHQYYLIGDAQNEVEGPIRKEQIVGVEDKVRRKGRWIGRNHAVALFFRYVWIRIVCARPLLRKVWQMKKRGIG